MEIKENFNPVDTETGQEYRWSRGRLEILGNCQICGCKESPSAEYICHDTHDIIPDTWRLVRCSNCSSLYLNPRPDQTSLPLAYAFYYTHDAEDDETTRDNLIWRQINGYLNWRFGMKRRTASRFGAVFFRAVWPLRNKLDYYGRHLPRLLPDEHKTLLDIGCGNGAFLRRAREMGYVAIGCEPDAKAIATCLDQGLDVLHGDAFLDSLPEEHFDVITMSHVFEHAPNPEQLLERAMALLAPGGLLWLACPNPDSIGFRLFKHNWWGIHAPFHLAIPTREITTKWLHNSGFEFVRQFTRSASSSYYWRMSENLPRKRGHAGIFSRICVVGTLIAISSFSRKFSDEQIFMAQRPG